MRRRNFTTATLGSGILFSAMPALPSGGNDTMYGLIGRIITIPGRRDELIDILLAGTSAMPGCLSYVVAKDFADANALWITEVWLDKASHAGSLSLPSVQAAIARGRPLIQGFGERFETEPVGGTGFAASDSHQTP